MSLAAQYAKALFAMKNPELARVRDVLVRRGHVRLMPRIVAEYQKLQLRTTRLSAQKAVTPERRRTQVLLELYQTLITTR